MKKHWRIFIFYRRIVDYSVWINLTWARAAQQTQIVARDWWRSYLASSPAAEPVSGYKSGGPSVTMHSSQSIMSFQVSQWWHSLAHFIHHVLYRVPTRIHVRIVTGAPIHHVSARKTVHNSTKTVQNGTKQYQNSTKTVQNGTKQYQNSTKTVRNGTKQYQNHSKNTPKTQHCNHH